MHTDDFEHLLDLPNVVGIEYDEATHRVYVMVRQKVPEADLDDGDIVANNVDIDSEVEDVGEIRPLGGDAMSVPGQPLGAPGKRHRPVPGGVSEAHANSTAGTCGPYPAEVTRIDEAEWHRGVKLGDRVRISNAHVYAGENPTLGQAILQPSPYDGGNADGDTVGELVGYVPVADGIRVDAAARSTANAQDSVAYHDLDNVGGVYRGDYPQSLTGQSVVKTGRTTEVTSGSIVGTTATIRVRYGVGTITVKDVITFGPILEGGDSGSPIFLEPDRPLFSLGFAGSTNRSFGIKIPNIEADLGVKFVEAERELSWWERLLRRLFARFSIRRQGD